MKTSLKKLFFIILSLIFIFSMSTSVFASSNVPTGTTTLEVVEDNVCTIEIEDMANFEKKITNFNAKEKSVTLTLSLTNIKSLEETQGTAEIFLVIDNSTSMIRADVGGMTRKEAVVNAAGTLVDKLFEANPQANVGVVSFSSSDQEGTINDAELLLELSNSKDEVQNAITELGNSETGIRTNIEAGLTVAQQNFSDQEDMARYIVLLTDGVPNNDIHGNSLTYSGEVATNTRNTINSIQQSGIDIIGAMINLDSESIEPTTGRTYRDLSEEIFGTVEDSSLSQYYYISDSEIEDTIANKIFDDLVVQVDNTLRNITIKDYFPQEIIDNFNFEYTASPNIGEVSQTVNTEDNSITWTIELLSEGETATLSYKLTLKDDYDKSIVDQILKTNTHVDITGEHNGNPTEDTSDVSPTIRVRYEEEPVIVPENKVDNTVSPTKLPQTGSAASIAFTAIVSILAIVIITRIVYLRRKMDK